MSTQDADAEQNAILQKQREGLASADALRMA